MAIAQMEEDVLIFPKLLNLLLFTRILFLVSLHLLTENKSETHGCNLCLKKKKKQIKTDIKINSDIKLVVITIFHMVNKLNKKLSMLNRDMENIKKDSKNSKPKS